MNSKGTLDREEIKLAPEESNILNSESQIDISRTHLKKIYRISSSEQRQNFKVLG